MNVNKLISAYVKLRDAKAEETKAYKERTSALDEKLDTISAVLLKHCNENEVTQVKGNAGTAFRQVKTRYWAPDWDNFKKFVKEYDALDLVEKRIAQGNYKQFVEEHPDVKPPVNSDSKYVITIRRGAKA